MISQIKEKLEKLARDFLEMMQEAIKKIQTMPEEDFDRIMAKEDLSHEAKQIAWKIRMSYQNRK